MNVDLTYQVMLPVLEMFHNLTHSYGWAIVLMTVLVRILVWPLVAQSTRSMQRMSSLQPQLKALQAKYKDDPTMFQQKSMEFYQKNKVNPMGGCLPTLVQLPILWALYATFMGPPFGDKSIDVKINVVPPAQAKQVQQQEVSGGNTPFVSADGKMAKLVVFPG
ncbi:MAG TPA: membrane protein insertase YidC, partial [Chroococcales cyanobacterium]